MIMFLKFLASKINFKEIGKDYLTVLCILITCILFSFLAIGISLVMGLFWWTISFGQLYSNCPLNSWEEIGFGGFIFTVILIFYAKFIHWIVTTVINMKHEYRRYKENYE